MIIPFSKPESMLMSDELVVTSIILRIGKGMDISTNNLSSLLANASMAITVSNENFVVAL